MQTVSARAKILSVTMAVLMLLGSVVGITRLIAKADNAGVYTVAYNKANFENARPDGGLASVNDDCIGGYSPYGTVKLTLTLPEGKSYDRIALEAAAPDIPDGETREIRVYDGTSPYADGTNDFNDSLGYVAVGIVHTGNWDEYGWSAPAKLKSALSGTVTLYLANRTGDKNANLRDIRLYEVKDDTAAYQDIVLSEHHDDVTLLGDIAKNEDGIGSFDEYDVFSVKLTLPEGKVYDRVALETATPSDSGPIRVYVNENPYVGGNWDQAGDQYANCVYNKTEWGVWDWSAEGTFPTEVSGEVTLYIGNRAPGACNVRTIRLYEKAGSASSVGTTTTKAPAEEGSFTLLVKDDKDAFVAENGANTTVNDEFVGGLDEYNMFSVKLTLPAGKTYDRVELYTASPDGAKNGFYVYINKSPVVGGNWNQEMAFTAVKRPVTDWNTYKWTNPVTLHETLSGEVTLYIGNRDTGACNVGGIRLFETGATATTYTTAAPSRPSVDMKEGDQMLFADPAWEVVYGAGSYNEGAGIIGGYSVGAVIKIPNVDFGEKGYGLISLLYATPDKLVPKDCQILIDSYPDGDVIGELRISATEQNWNENIYAFADSEMLEKVTGVHDVYIINGTSGNFNVQGIKLSGTYTGSGDTSKEAPSENDPADSLASEDTVSSGSASGNDSNPDTGVALPAAVLLLTAVTGAAVAVTRKKK